MAAKPIRKLVVKTGEYIDNVSGKNKGRWLQVGTLFKHDDGNLSIKLEAVPMSRDFDGWISVFPLDDQAQPPGPALQSTYNQAQARQPHPQRGQAYPDSSSDIPF